MITAVSCSVQASSYCSVKLGQQDNARDSRELVWVVRFCPPTSSSPRSRPPPAIQKDEVVLPTAAHGEIRLRCVTQPDAAQAVLLERLDIVLPKRMRTDDLDLPLALNV
jgi:hypothetical protein